MNRRHRYYPRSYTPWWVYVLGLIATIVFFVYAASLFVDCNNKGGVLIRGAFWPPYACVQQDK